MELPEAHLLDFNIIKLLRRVLTMFLDKNMILNADDIKTDAVDVPEWGGTVLVKALNGAERDSFEASIVTGSGNNVKMNMENIRAKLVVRSIVGEDGKRLFSDSDAEILANKSAAALDRVFTIAQALSGIGEKDLKEMVKNSEADPNADSTIDLQEN